MGIITDIKTQTKNKSRVSVFIDGEFYCGLEKITAMSFGLKPGDEVDPEKLSVITKDSEREAAFNKGAGYLAVRPRTKKEMRVYLTGKGFSPDTVSHTVEKMCEYGYINDYDFCRAYVEEYSKKWGAKKIQADLMAKGVSKGIIEECLSGVSNSEDAVLSMAEKYLRSHNYDKRKLTAYLLRRGFGYDEINSALKNADILYNADDSDF